MTSDDDGTFTDAERDRLLAALFPIPPEVADRIQQAAGAAYQDWLQRKERGSSEESSPS